MSIRKVFRNASRILTLVVMVVLFANCVHGEDLQTLLSRLDPANVPQSCQALIQISEMGTAASSAGPTIANMLLGYYDEQLTYTAAYTLGCIGATDSQSISALSSAASFPWLERIRFQGASALAKLGTPGLNALLSIRNDSRYFISGTAAYAIRGQDQEDSESGFPTISQMAEGLLYPAWEDVQGGISNGSFEDVTGSPATPTGWSLVTEGGASGSWEIDQSHSRTGSRSLRVTKSGTSGRVILRSNTFVQLTAGTVYTLRLYFQMDGSEPNSVMVLRLRDSSGALYAGNVNYASTLYSQTPTRNTAPGFWDKRVLTFQPPTNMQLQPEIIIAGNPCSVLVDDFSFPSTPYTLFSATYVENVAPLTTAQACAQLAQQAESTGKVVSSEGRTGLLINDQPVLPAFYKPAPCADWDICDYTYFSKYGGVNLHLLPVIIGEVAYPWFPNTTPVIRGDGTYDFTTPLKMLEGFARRTPNDKAVVELVLDIPLRFLDQHPSEYWRDVSGQKAYGTAMHFCGFTNNLPAGYVYWPSPASTLVRDYIADVITDFITALKATPYSKMVVGFQISGGHDGQFYTSWPDFSDPALSAFRQWLTAKYCTDQALQCAWNDPNVTLATAAIPANAGQQQTGPPFKTFLNPLVDTPYVDYDNYMQTQGVRQVDYYAQTVKSAMGKDVFVLTYRMGDGNGLPVIESLKSQWIDGQASQPSYHDRYPGFYSGIPCAAYGSFNLRGKLLIKELDTRTYCRGWNGDEVEDMRIGVAANPDWFAGLLMKEVGQQAVQGQGWWFYDISSTSFRDKALQGMIEKVDIAAGSAVHSTSSFRPDVVLVYDWNPGWLAPGLQGNGGVPYLTAIEKYQRALLSLSGVPYDQYYLDDIMNNQSLQDYKVYVFMNTYRLTSAQRCFINTVLKGGNRTLVWLYAPGYVTDQGLTVDGIFGLTGMHAGTTGYIELASSLPAGGTDPICSGLTNLQGAYDMVFQTFNMSDWGWITTDAQRFWIQEGEGTPITRYVSDNKIAAAVKRFCTWTSVHVAAQAGISPKLFNNIAADAGAYVLTTPGPSLDMNGSLISLHGVKGGTYTLNLPRQCTVRDMMSGSILATDASSLVLNLNNQESKWLLLE